MKKTILLLLLSFIFFSCSEDYKMKSDFKKEFKKQMHDPSSFELVEFIVAKKSMEFTIKNRKYIDSVYAINKQYDNYSKMYDSIFEVEKLLDENILYTQVLAKVRGKNRMGATILNSHVVLFRSDNTIHSIDGNIIY